MSSINFMGQQYYKWPLLSPLAEEEPGISWLRSCTPTKLQIRKQLVRSRKSLYPISQNTNNFQSVYAEIKRNIKMS
jgi:hypothetical protein